VTLHDASNIAAVIVEPVACSTGVLVPPKGYLQRLREICTKHGILLIFDEVITGFGRLGASFATEYFGIVPDLITTAKGITNGTIPMGAVFARKGIYDAFMNAPDNTIELFHGYTYSGHPSPARRAWRPSTSTRRRTSSSAPPASPATGRTASIRSRARPMSSTCATSASSPASSWHRGRASRAGAASTFLKAYESDLLVRVTGDIIALSPPLICEKKHIDDIFGILGDVLKKVD
jgi:Adenosylmethionine-8-amino-7-oxononanoate aminotransferase